MNVLFKYPIQAPYISKSMYIMLPLYLLCSLLFCKNGKDLSGLEFLFVVTLHNWPFDCSCPFGTVSFRMCLIGFLTCSRSSFAILSPLPSSQFHSHYICVTIPWFTFFVRVRYSRGKTGILHWWMMMIPHYLESAHFTGLFSCSACNVPYNVLWP